MSNEKGMDETILQTVFQEILSAKRILIVSHIRPDGDAVGSLIGLGLSLQSIGKDVQMVLSDGVPAIFRHLEGSELVKKKSTGNFDMTLVVDCSDLNRTGKALNKDLVPDLNLDHHPTNTIPILQRTWAKSKCGQESEGRSSRGR